jgi:hypothetical protein
VIGFVKSHHHELSRILREVQLLGTHQQQQQQQDEQQDEYIQDNRYHQTVLEQVRLITSIFYLLSHHIIITRERLHSTFPSFESNMLHVMRVCSKLSKGQDEPDHALQIVKNVVGYCRVVTQNPLANYAVTPVILFQATADESVDARISSGRVPSIKSLVVLLEQNLNQLAATLEKRESTANNLLRVVEIPPQQLQELLKTHGDNDTRLRIDEQSPRNGAALTYRYQIILSQQLVQLDERLSSYQFVVEGLLLVLWRHLNMYTQFTSSPQQGDMMLQPRLILSPTQKENMLHDISGVLERVLEVVTKVNKVLKSDFLNFMLRELKEPRYWPQAVKPKPVPVRSIEGGRKGGVSFSPFVQKRGYEQNQ